MQHMIHNDGGKAILTGDKESIGVTLIHYLLNYFTPSLYIPNFLESQKNLSKEIVWKQSTVFITTGVDKKSSWDSKVYGGFLGMWYCAW